MVSTNTLGAWGERVLDKYRAAIPQLDALQPGYRTDTPEGRLQFASQALALAVYDWKAINSTLFPDGKLDFSQILSTPIAQQWLTLRKDQQQALADYIADPANFDPAKRHFSYGVPGITLELEANSLASLNPQGYQPADVFNILAQLPFNYRPRPGYENRYYMGSRVPQDEVARGKPTYQMAAALEGEIMGVWGQFFSHQWTPPEVLDTHVVAQVKSAIERTLVIMNPQKMAARAIRDAAIWKTQYEDRLRMEADQLKPPRKAPGEYLKSRIEAGQAHKDARTAMAEFKAWQFLGRRAKNANASRTWGVELEVIDAGKIITPAGGWLRERDQSLPVNPGDGRTYDPWEFISPILTKTFDPGLWMVCDQAKGTVKYQRAGVHIHIDHRTRQGAPMTRADVSRLLEIYTVTAPLTDVIIQRRNRKFCGPTEFDQWAQGWLHHERKAVRPHRLAKQAASRHAHLAIDNAKMWAEMTKGPNHDEEPTHWRRHQEINLQSLNKHGTIEFRSLGAVYDYEYIEKWAWMLREFMNYAQSQLPLEPFYKVRTMTDLINLLEITAVEKLNPVKKKKFPPPNLLDQELENLLEIEENARPRVTRPPAGSTFDLASLGFV